MSLYTPDMAGSGQYGNCAKCGKEPTKEGHDGCIGTLPSKQVMNACCGHGDDSSAYVQFWDKPRISGQQAINYIKLNNDKHIELPVYGEPVLAKLRHQNSLGVSQWYEVVCIDDFGWVSYSGSSTFKDGETVVDWKYCKDLFKE